jgi:photosystem II stability/assembly factor-like uncharacterized protein
VLPHTVLGCVGLGGVGEWQSILPAEIDLSCQPDSNGFCTNTGPTALALDPQTSGVIYMGTSKQGIWKSTDCGDTFAKVTTGNNSEMVDRAWQRELIVDPIDPQVMYARGEYTSDYLYKSTNGGVDWDQLWPLYDPVLSKIVDYNTHSGLDVDPADHNHLLMAFNTGCTGQYAPACLVESHDGGWTWTFLKVDADSSGRAWFVDSSTWLYGPNNGGLLRSSDSGLSWQVLANSSLGQVLSPRIYRSKLGGFYLGAIAGVLYSPDGAFWSMIPNSDQSVHAGVTGDGNTVFMSARGICSKFGDNMQTYYTAPEADGKPWTPLESPGMEQGARDLAYDLDHNVLYSANCMQGLWRVVTK